MSEMQLNWRQFLTADSVCDFCQAPPTWMHVAEEFGIGVVTATGVEVMTFDPWWAACDECHELVQGRKWGELAHRAYTKEVREDWTRQQQESAVDFLVREMQGLSICITDRVETIG